MFKIPTSSPAHSVLEPLSPPTSRKSSSSPSCYKSLSCLLPPPALHPQSRGTIHQGRTPLEGRAGGEAEQAKPERDWGHSSEMSEFPPQGGGCQKSPRRDEKQFLVCICAPHCSLWLFEFSLQGTYPSHGDFDPYSSLNIRHVARVQIHKWEPKKTVQVSKPS